MNYSDFFLWGFVATSLLSSLLSLAQGAGVTRISLPYLLGTAVSGQRNRAMVLGIILHFMVGMVFALIQVAVIESLGWTNAWLGLLIGGMLGVFSLTVLLQLLPYVHPRLASRHQGPTPERRLEPPGFLGMNYGRSTPLVTLLAHLVFGLVLGTFYPPS